MCGCMSATPESKRRRVDELAEARTVPLLERHEHPDRREEAGADVDQRDAGPGRPGLRLAVDAEPAGHRLDGPRHIPGSRPSGPVAPNPLMRQWISRGKRVSQRLLVPEAPFLERAGLEVLDQDVRLLEQAQQHLATLRSREVEPERALVSVDADEVRGVAVLERRPPVAHLVALRRLDLHDLGAVIGEHLRAVRPAEHSRQVDDDEPGKGAASRPRLALHYVACPRTRAANSG